MLENWKQQNARVSLVWGTSEFEEKELDRPEFVGNLQLSFIDGSQMVWFPPVEQSSKFVLSFALLSAMLSLICGVVASIYVLKFELSSSLGSYASVVASVVNTIQITLFNMIYEVLCNTKWMKFFSLVTPSKII